MSARQLSRLLDPADDYMLLVIGDAHRLFGSPQAPPQVRILISPPAAVTTKGGGNTAAAAAAAAGGAAHAQQQRQFKHGPRRNAHTGTPAAPMATMTTITTSEAEVIVDSVLDRGSRSRSGGSSGGGGSAGAVADHILEYVATSGFQNIQRHWQFNRKRLVRLMLTSRATSLAAADTTTSKASNLAAEMLLQLAAELAGGGQPGPDDQAEEVRVDPSDGRPYPLKSFVEVYGLEEGLGIWESLRE